MSSSTTFIKRKSVLSAIAVVREDLRRRKKNSKNVPVPAVLNVLKSRITRPFSEDHATERISQFL